MRGLAWCDSTTATAPPRVRVERFCGPSRRRVHLLAEVRCLKTHKKQDENTVPCLGGEDCPYCTDPLWKPRLEHFVPALLMDEKAQCWVHIVAVFTGGGWNKLNRKPGPHRGRLLDVSRRMHGNASGGVLEVKELARVEPTIPAFDIEPHLMALWFPHAERQRVEVPAPIPYVPAHPEPARTAPEPFRFTPEAAAKMKGMLGKFLAHDQAEAEPKPPGELAVTAIAADPKAYGPRKHVTGGAANGSIDKSAGGELLGAVLEQLPANHPARLNGRGKGGGS